MQTSTTRIALFLLVGAATMVGFDGGCGTSPPQPLPTPSPTPSPSPTMPPEVECVDLLEEAACTADASCRAVFVRLECVCAECPAGQVCPPCQCDQEPTQTFVGCEDRPTGCASLDENACSADPACEPVYSEVDCLSAPDEPGAPAPCAQPGPGCGCRETAFAGCRDRSVCAQDLACPPIFCEFGTVVDASGCNTCECAPPPPNPCQGLDEQTCIAVPGCDPTYSADTGSGDGSGAARPCDCQGEGCFCAEDPIPSGYAGCVPSANTCEGLDEGTCQMTRGCRAEYLYPPCAPPCDPSDADCGGDEDPGRPFCPPVFTQCVNDVVPSGCTSDFDCLGGGYCDYGTSTEPAPGTGAEAPDDRAQPAPPPYGQCVYVSCGDGAPVLCDAIPPTCGVGQVAGAWGGCWSCFDARTCTPVSQPSECTSDFDCRGGYCESGASTAPGSGSGSSGDAAPPAELRPEPPVPPEGGYCVYPTCGDGAPIECNGIPPSCDVGQVAGAWGGCWACFDARTCLPIEPAPSCVGDTDCPNGYCDNGMNGALPPSSGEDRALPAPPPPPLGMCVFPLCGDGSVLACRQSQPTCDPGFTASVVNGCWECLDARVCIGAPEPTPCDPATTDCG